MHQNQKTRILILGASGMLGSTIFRAFALAKSLVTFGTVRNISKTRYFSPELHDALIPDVNVDNEEGILRALSIAKPDVVINCIGVIKQLPNANNHLDTLSTNAVLPHRLAKYCDIRGARLIHFSTDCVFSGEKGQYRETDFPDSHDLYGRTKLLGEVEYGNTVTLRTSIIGHELGSNRSLVDWFLSQTSGVMGFKKAIFSGLPTIEVAHIIRDLIIPNNELRGLYHLSADPINKLDLLQLIAKTYQKDITITPDDTLVIDRSLLSDRFRSATGYAPRTWPDLIKSMYKNHLQTKAREV